MKSIALCAAAASAVCAASAGDMSKTPGTVCDVLERAHVSHRAPDDVISRRAWTNLVESCDQQRLTFLASDIERFAKQETSLDDMFKKNAPNYAQSPSIKWNFTKFLVDQKGNVVKRYEPTDKIADIDADICALLNKKCCKKGEGEKCCKKGESAKCGETK